MPAPPLSWDDPRVVVLVLLVAGHVLADFLFQTRRMIQRKRAGLRGLLLHSLQVVAVQGAVLLPYAFSWSAVLAVLVVGLVHLAVDRTKVRLDASHPERRALWFLGDQSLHLATLLALWPWIQAPAPGPFDAEVARAAGYAAVFAFNGRGAGVIVQATLRSLAARAPVAAGAASEEAEGPDGAGALIGMLERWIVLGLACVGQWGAVGLVLTAKSVARFKRMDEQAFAEIYLVGTMTSVLVAMASGALLRTLWPLAPAG